MKTLFQKYILIFYSSILLMLPIMNALHFVLIDHQTQENSDTKKITHHCDDYILYQVFYAVDFNQKLKTPQWIEYVIKHEIVYQNLLQSNYFLEILNKGPPYSIFQNN